MWLACWLLLCVRRAALAVTVASLILLATPILSRGTDAQTGSVWDPVSLEAVSGTLAGKRLDRLIGMFALRDTWSEFHPDSQAVD